MKIRSCLSLLLLCSMPTLAFAESFKWPNGARAAINLAYDDALDSQLDNAIPQLNRHKLQGTFYLTLSADTLKNRLADWRAAAAAGHELANHTLFHQCSKSAPGRDWVPEHRDLDKVSALQMQDQIRVGNILLNAIDGKTERTLTSPCIDTKAAGGEPYLPGIYDEFVAIKAQNGGIVEDMVKLNPYSVGAEFPVGVTGKQLIERAKEAAAKGTMLNLTFHGVGGDHMVVSAEAHEEFLVYLAANRDIYWVDTFVNIMKYVREQQAQISAGR